VHNTARPSFLIEILEVLINTSVLLVLLRRDNVFFVSLFRFGGVFVGPVAGNDCLLLLGFASLGFAFRQSGRKAAMA
jgi:hypothetical protein